MRPLSLTVEGLRSFRKRVDVNFGDRKLVAIVGDTGVGKSSLLEAITYALYAGSTWTAHNTALISDTATDMFVELTFVCDGKTYTVTRSNSRANRPATAQLYCHDDNRTVDNVRTVNSEIETLLGLDRDTFLKTVILPQGKFATLLMSTPGERNQVLRSIFRVDALDAVRDAAKEIRDRVFPHVEGVKQRLAMLPDDPAGDRKEAKARKAQATTAATKLLGARKACRELEKKRSNAALSAEQLRGILVELAEIDVSEIESQLVAVAQQAADLASQRAQLENAARSAAERIATLSSKRKAESDDGLDERVLTRAQATLEALVGQVPELKETIEGLRADAKELADLEKKTDDLSADTKRKKTAHEKAKRVANEHASKLRDATENFAKAESALEQAIEKRDARSGAEARLGTDTERLAAAQAELTAAAANATAAELELANAKAKYEELERAHAASHAAEGSEPGSPCPICARELPGDFKPPKAPGLMTARARVEKAERGSRDTAERVATLRAVVTNADEQCQASKQGLTRAAAEDKTASKRLTKLLGEEVLDLSKPAKALLQVPREALADADRQDKSLRNKAEEAQGLAGAATAAESQHGEAVRREQSRLTQNRSACERRLRGLAGDIAGIPETLRPSLGDLKGLDAIETKKLVAQPLNRSLSLVQKRLVKLEEISNELDKARAALDAARAELSQLATHVDDEVTRPRQNIASLLQGVANDLKSMSARGGTALPKIRVALDNLEESVPEIVAQRGSVKKQTEGELTRVNTVERGADEELRDLLAAHEADDLDTLDERLDRVNGEKAQAEIDVERAEKSLAAALELKQKVGVGGQLVDDLADLREILGKFIAEVLTSRSQALLAVASRRLIEMTGGRFAFTKEFEVLDQLTGQPRKAETLSGGESFLASLSLALGMVDLAARAGGRLDALFLDEGFGALDETNLNAAIDALEATSAEGRMVAVISHVKAVADRIDDVMVVLPEPEGSDAVWLDDAERAGLHASELSAAMSGLLN